MLSSNDTENTQIRVTNCGSDTSNNYFAHNNVDNTIYNLVSLEQRKIYLLWNKMYKPSYICHSAVASK